MSEMHQTYVKQGKDGRKHFHRAKYHIRKTFGSKRKPKKTFFSGPTIARLSPKMAQKGGRSGIGSNPGNRNILAENNFQNFSENFPMFSNGFEFTKKLVRQR